MASLNFLSCCVILCLSACITVQGASIANTTTAWNVNETTISEQSSNSTQAPPTNSTSAPTTTAILATTSNTPVASSCTAWGSTFTPVQETGCRRYLQSVPGTAAAEKNCPVDLLFDVTICQCNYADKTSC